MTAPQNRKSSPKLFKDTSFTIHKWHSNVPDLTAISSSPCEEEISYTKQQLGGAKMFEGKILGVPWNREQDLNGIIQTETTKRVVLCHLAKIYDPLGLASPVTLIRKQLYCVKTRSCGTLNSQGCY